MNSSNPEATPTAPGSGFKFEIDDQVTILATGFVGIVTGRQEFTDRPTEYRAYYRSVDGIPLEQWIVEARLSSRTDAIDLDIIQSIANAVVNKAYPEAVHESDTITLTREKLIAMCERVGISIAVLRNIAQEADHDR